MSERQRKRERDRETERERERETLVRAILFLGKHFLIKSVNFRIRKTKLE